jgi:hypothetical protein
MGHNRAGDNARAKARRRHREEARLAQKQPQSERTLAGPTGGAAGVVSDLPKDTAQKGKDAGG